MVSEGVLVVRVGQLRMILYSYCVYFTDCGSATQWDFRWENYVRVGTLFASNAYTLVRR